MLRLILAALLISGFVYTSLEVKENFTNLMVQHHTNIETVMND